MGKRIFIDDQEMTNKDDFDQKVNTDRNLYLLNETSPLTESEIFNTSDAQGRLQVIHQRIQENGSETLGGYDNILLFGGDDATSIFDVNTFQNQLRVSSGLSGGKAAWSEFVAWKSDLGTKTIIQDVDINTLTTEGNFFVESNNLDHFPAGYQNQWYFLNVVNPVGADRIKQTVTPDDSYRLGWTMTRTGTYNSDTHAIVWTSWLISDFANGKLLKI